MPSNPSNLVSSGRSRYDCEQEAAYQVMRLVAKHGTELIGL